jgi:hypothetical protein
MTGNFIEMFLKISEKFVCLRRDNGILGKKMETISANERLSVACV